MSKKPRPQPCDQSQWVFLIPDSALQDSENPPAVCKLRHPKSGQSAAFLFSQNDSKLHEVLQFREDHRSWIIDQNIQQDGSLFITSPVDPLFLVLPYLIKAEKGGKFMTLDQLVHDEEFPECSRLCSCQGLDELSQVVDSRGDEDFKAYRYNKDRTLTWLKYKVERVASKLEEKQIGVGGSTVGSIWVKSNKSHSCSKEDFIRLAHGIISDYLSPELSKELHQHLGIKEVTHEKPEVQEPPAKRVKTETVQPTEDYSLNTNDENHNKKAEKLTAAQKSLKKVDKSGMKSIASFFGKPKK